jgi:23S rRNA (guanosine2251-2'-O)-methyltransferase
VPDFSLKSREFCHWRTPSPADYTSSMNAESPTGKSRKSLASSHQRSWLWGRHAVIETLTAGRWPVIELLVDENLPEAQFEHLRQLVVENRTTIQRVSSRRILELCRAEDHQGYLARMAEFPYRTLRDLNSRLSNPATESQQSLAPLFVICDRIQDAHNFGAILRCCDAMKVDGVIIGEKSQVSVTPHVARASSGAVNHLEIYRVPALAESLQSFTRHGFTVLGASEKAESFLWQTSTGGPSAIVIGSEATGIAPELQTECNQQIAIPMLGGVDSLNAAVAAGIILYECRRQQLSSGR